jgi:hypothetical protein
MLGDFAPGDAIVGTYRTGASGAAAPAGDRAWDLALRAQSWLARPDRAPLPTSDEVSDLAGKSGLEEPLDWACHLIERAHWLARRTPELRRCLAAHERVAGRTDRWWLSVGWAELLSGEASAALSTVDQVTGSSGRTDPVVVIEVTALAALGASVRRDLDEATKLARRASRMARTESFPQEEYLANVVLARIRRLAGTPHLAARILGALDAVAPSPWKPWIGWELALAGSGDDLRGDERGYTLALDRFLSAFSIADGSSLEGARCQLAEVLGREGELTRDVVTLETLSGLRGRMGEPRVDGWVVGTIDPVVDGLHGVGAAPPDASPSTESEHEEAAYVRVTPDAPARRILRLGRRLFERQGAPTLTPGPGRQARTEATIAMLALAGGDGLAEDDLFRRMYGFEYKPDLHRAVRNTLMHRVRQRLGDLATIERESNRVRMVPLAPFLVPDPRCSPTPEDAVLLAIARWGRVSPKDTADRLGIPLRTAQAVLRRLAEEGVFRVEKDGRALLYALEDTTFREPTWLNRR